MVDQKMIKSVRTNNRDEGHSKDVNKKAWSDMNQKLTWRALVKAVFPITAKIPVLS